MERERIAFEDTSGEKCPEEIVHMTSCQFGIYLCIFVNLLQNFSQTNAEILAQVHVSVRWPS